MKKYLTTLPLIILAVILLSCNTSTSDESKDQTPDAVSDSHVSKSLPTEKLDSIASLLVRIAANDLYKNQQPAPVNFSNVKLKYIKKQNGEELYILCGQFTKSDNQETQFATVKNSDYEQWIGTSALTYCQDSKELPYTKVNLSSELKCKYDSIKNKLENQ